jgi:hypothetical protein
MMRLVECTTGFNPFLGGDSRAVTTQPLIYSQATLGQIRIAFPNFADPVQIIDGH